MDSEIAPHGKGVGNCLAAYAPEYTFVAGNRYPSPA
jgi:hypothetical protein